MSSPQHTTRGPFTSESTSQYSLSVHVFAPACNQGSLHQRVNVCSRLQHQRAHLLPHESARLLVSCEGDPVPLCILPLLQVLISTTSCQQEGAVVSSSNMHGAGLGCRWFACFVASEGKGGPVELKLELLEGADFLLFLGFFVGLGEVHVVEDEDVAVGGVCEEGPHAAPVVNRVLEVGRPHVLKPKPSQVLRDKFLVWRHEKWLRWTQLSTGPVGRDCCDS